MSTNAVLKDLVQTLEDGRKGFSDAAEKLASDGNASLASQFQGFAEQRAQFSAELRSSAQSEGLGFEEDGSIAGALHRGWMSMKDALTGNDPDAIVNAVGTGEEHAVSEYEKALDNNDLPASLTNTVRRQADEIRSVRDQVKALGSR